MTTPWFGKGLAAFLKIKPDLQCVGEAATGAEAIALCDRLQPDVALNGSVDAGNGRCRGYLVPSTIAGRESR